MKKTVFLMMIAILFAMGVRAQTVEFIPLGQSTTYTPNDTFVVVGDFSFENLGPENFNVYWMRFVQTGSVDGALLPQLMLWDPVTSCQVSVQTVIVDSCVRFDVTIPSVSGALVIAPGSFVHWQIILPVVPNVAALQTIQFRLETVTGEINGSSFQLVDEQGDLLTNQTRMLHAYTVDSGFVTVWRDSLCPGNQYVVPGQQHVEMSRVDMQTSQTVSVAGLQFDFLGHDANHFENFEIWVADTLWSSATMNLSAQTIAANAPLEIDSFAQVKLFGDVIPTAVADARIKPNLAAVSGLLSPVYVSTGQPVPTDHLLGFAAGSWTKVGIMHGYLTPDTSIPDTIFISGGDSGVVVHRAFLHNQAMAGDAVGFRFSVVGTGNCNPLSNFEAQMRVDGVLIGTPHNVSVQGELWFSDALAHFEPWEVKTVELVANTIPASAPGTVEFSLIGIDLMQVSYNGAPLSATNPLAGPVVKLMTATGVPAISDFPVIQVWPNPTEKYISSDVPSETPYSVVDLQGRQLCSGIFSQKIDCTQWQSGTYFVRFMLPEGPAIKRVVKK